jgi:C1A family cysteine protease
MSTREFGRHLQLNHKPSSSQKHVEIYKAGLQNHKLKVAAIPVKSFPINFTLAKKYTLSILDQGSLGSCVCNSMAAVLQSSTGILPSRLYFYFNGLVATGNPPNQDNGLDILQALPVFCNYGVISESIWPYDINNFGIMPPLNSYQNAKIAPAITWAPINQTDNDIKTALSANKFVMLGIIIYSSFMTSAVAKNGIVPVPNMTKEKSEGGHCIHIVGWTTYKNVPYYIVRNSWGTSWGNDGNPISPAINNGSNGGFCFIPTAYILNPKLAFEFISVA